MSEGDKEAVRADDEVVTKVKVVALQKQIRQLQRYTGRRPHRAHEGIIRTIHPNARWTSDGLPIPCSDQVVHVALSLDTCDREISSWCAGTGAISWR